MSSLDEYFITLGTKSTYGDLLEAIESTFGVTSEQADVFRGMLVKLEQSDQNKTGNLWDEIEDLQNKIEDLESENRSLTDEIDELETELERLKKGSHQ